jgi:acetate kinase
MSPSVLTVNAGSSSIKFALYSPGDPPTRILGGGIERIGLAESKLSVRTDEALPAERTSIDAPDFSRAIAALFDCLEKRVGLDAIAAVGHRVVHGGERYAEACVITQDVVSELKRLQPLDPEHLPAEIALIQAFTQRLPRVPQIACFDTAFHHDLPRVAQLLPIPRRYQSAGVRRYGFHGLSYTYLLRELARTAGEEVAEERVILAHLGAGCSMAAVRGGKCVDTTMAFTPSAGLMMGTRSGDLDPGVLIHLMRSEGLSAEQIDELVNHRSGLLGVSETSPDMRDLLARRESDLRAAEAVELFCHSAKKWVGALAASLGGLDTLVFSGGVGENAPQIRARICSGLGFLGIRLDQQRNAANDGVVSTDGSPVVVHVIRTDEESIIVREAQRLAGVSIAEPAHVS